MVPTSYSFSASDVVSVNGSSVTGQCSTFTDSGGRTICNDPTSSVLFDRIPTLTGLENSSWASQLLALRPLVDGITKVTFDFIDLPVRVDGVEVVMFNCPQWGIGVQPLQHFRI